MDGGEIGIERSRGRRTIVGVVDRFWMEGEGGGHVRVKNGVGLGKLGLWEKESQG